MDMKASRFDLKHAYDLPAIGRGIPDPSKPLILSVNHPVHAATVDLLEGSLRYYRLELSDILLGDRLRAHFNVHFLGNAYPVAVRYDRGEIETQDRYLRAFLDEPLAAWNLIQLRSAMYFMDHASPSGRAVDLQTIERFGASPTDFYRLMQDKGMNARPI